MDLCADANRCEFCYAFFAVASQEAEHNRNCEFRLSRTFLASDGEIKFVCTVCRDVFATECQLKTHENLHKYPGGYVCSVCDDKFRNEVAQSRHEAKAHQLFKCLWCDGNNTIPTEAAFVAHLTAEHDGHGRHAMCTLCGAFFEQKTYLRLHRETNCGRSCAWKCTECGVECDSESALAEHARTVHVAADETDCIHVEENPLILPKIEVSSIDYLESRTEECQQSDDHNNKSNFIASKVGAESDFIAIDNAESNVEIKPDSPVEVKVEHISIDEDFGSDNEGESDEMDFVNSTERWNQTLENEFECSICGVKFGFVDGVKAHIALHGPAGNRIHQCTHCDRYYSTVDKMLRHQASDHNDDGRESDGSKDTSSPSTAKRYKCTYCNLTYLSVASRNFHVERHGPNGILIHKCTCCTAYFESRKDMLKHRFNTHKNTVCNICRPRLTFKSTSVLASHMRLRHRKRSTVLKCRVCKHTFKSEAELRTHGWKQHAASTCKECGKIFLKPFNLRRHATFQVCRRRATVVDDTDIEESDIDGEPSLEATDIGETSCKRNDDNADADAIDSIDPAIDAMDNAAKMKMMKSQLKNWKARGIRKTFVTCLICYNQYGMIRSLENHIKAHGSNGRLSIKCNQCKDYLASKEDLDAHVAAAHQHPQCHICGRSYRYKSGLQMHLDSAHERFKCEKCGTAFNKQFYFLKHVRTDCDTIPEFKCKLCESVFHTANDRKQHEDEVHKTQAKQKCPTCGKTFDTMKSLKLHMGAAHVATDFPCRHCGKSYKSRNQLLSHLTMHMNILPFKCLGCNQAFESINQLEMHRIINKDTCKLKPLTDECIRNVDIEDAEVKPIVKSKEFNCKHCDKSFKSFRRRQAHVLTCHKDILPKEIKCNYCDKTFKRRPDFVKHTTLHGANGERVHKCACCLRYFETADERVRHENTVHIDRLKCTMCDKRFKRPHALRVHVQNTHERRNECICSKCGRNFQSERALTIHEESDCGKTPTHKCKYCGKSLTTSATLQLHIDIMHENAEKKFVCSHCGKAWHSLSGLQTHFRIHSGEKPYKCGFCEKSFSSRTSKMTHESIHTGIKPYMCQCGDRFSCISNLQSHRKVRKTTCGLLPLISKRFPEKIKADGFESV